MKASFGKVIITPKGGAKGVPMAGYTRPFPAQGKLDDIYARGVLVETQLDNGDNKRMLILSLDLLKIPLTVTEYMKAKLQNHAEFELESELILIHAIHTHSAPDLTGEFYWPGNALNVFRGLMFGANRNDKYIVYFTHLIVKMVRQMVRDLEPAKIAQTSQTITEDIVINRRNPMRRSKKDLWLLVFKRIKDNQIFGILGNYAMHPTSLSYLNDKMSADYPGRYCYKIEADSQNQISAMFITGPAGDLNPITTCGTDFETLQNDPEARKTVYDQLGTYAHTKKIGYFLADQSIGIAQGIPDDEYYDSLKYRGYMKKFSIPIIDKQPFVYNWGTWLTNKIVFYLKRAFLFPIAAMHGDRQEPNFPGMALKIAPRSVKFKQRMRVHTVIQSLLLALFNASDPLSIKNLHILGVPGEVFEDLGERIINLLPEGSQNTVIFQNTNDWVGYLFEMKDYVGQGGYEPIATSTPIAGKAILKEFRLLFKEIQKT